MYLETIYVLSQKKNFVRAIDICEEMGYSKPSVSRAMGLLRDGGYINVAKDGGITLTDLGLEVADRTYERHQVLSKFLINIFLLLCHIKNQYLIYFENSSKIMWCNLWIIKKEVYKC